MDFNQLGNLFLTVIYNFISLCHTFTHGFMYIFMGVWLCLHISVSMSDPFISNRDPIPPGNLSDVLQHKAVPISCVLIQFHSSVHVTFHTSISAGK